MKTVVRIYCRSNQTHYLVGKGGEVYASAGEDRLIRQARPADPRQHPIDDLRAAAEFFDEYFLAPFSGIATNDGRFISRGRLNAREAERFESGEGIRGRRSALEEHLDFFDQNPADGRITLRKNFAGWRALGFGRLRSALQTFLSSVLFGRIADGLAIDIDRIEAKRKGGNTGIYDANGEVDAGRLKIFLEAFDQAASAAGTLAISQRDARAIIDRFARLGLVSSGQFRSLFKVCERLNHGSTITREQFGMLFEGSLLVHAASFPKRSGRAGIETLVS